MRLRTALRFAGWWWVLPVEVLLGYMFVLAALAADVRYPLASQVLGNQSLALIAPVCAMAAAWSAARLRRADYDSRPRRRHALAVRADRIAPLVGLSLIALTAASLAVARANDALGMPDLRLGVIAVLTLTSFALLGDALGSRMPIRIAAPARVVLPYFVIAFPPAMEPLWLRHMVGVTSSCCAVFDTLSTRVFIACGLTYTALALVGISFLPSSSPSGTRLVRRAVVASLAVAALVTSAWTVSGMGTDPTEPRQGTLVCHGSAPAVCTWPEHARVAAVLVPLMNRVRVVGTTAGIPLPSRIIERSADRTSWPESPVDFNVIGEQRVLENELVSALTPQLASTCMDALQRRGLAAQIEVYLIASAAITSWWRTTLGIPAPTSGLDDPDAQRLAAKLQTMTQVAAARIISTTVELMSRCAPISPSLAAS